jgi:hypothetical protein
VVAGVREGRAFAQDLRAHHFTDEHGVATGIELLDDLGLADAGHAAPVRLGAEACNDIRDDRPDGGILRRIRRSSPPNAPGIPVQAPANQRQNIPLSP